MPSRNSCGVTNGRSTAWPGASWAGAGTPRTPRRRPSSASVLAQERRIVTAALRSLPPRQRAALVLRDVQGLSTREVAEVLGSREVTVRTQICRARLKLRRFRGRIQGKEEP